MKELIIFNVPKDRNDFLKKFYDIDIILDTFPYSGGTTNLEAAWMGVPTLTMKGNTFLSKCGESININLGMKNWIAMNEEDYCNKALLFSSSIKDLEDYRSKLLYEKNTNKIFDNKEFADNLLKLFKDLTL